MPTAAKLAFDAAAVVTIVVVHLSLSLSLSIVPKWARVRVLGVSEEDERDREGRDWGKPERGRAFGTHTRSAQPSVNTWKNIK